MSPFILICAGLGLLAGLLEAWNNNQKRVNENQQNNIKPKKENTIIFCTNCGNKLQENEKFCCKCGQQVSREIVKNENSLNQENHTEQKGFNSKKTGIILIIGVAILGVLAIMGFNNLGSDNIISGNKKYEDIAVQYIETTSKDYLSYMTLVNTSSYTLDKEVRVTLKYRFTEGPNTSYLTYIIAIDKDTKKVVAINHYSN